MCTLPVKLCSGVHSYHTRETINSYTEAASIMFEILCHTAPILFLSSIQSSASLIIQLVYILNNYYDTTPPLLHSNRDLEPFPGLTIDSQLYSTTAIMILSASSCLPLTVLCGGGSVGRCMGGVVGGGVRPVCSKHCLKSHFVSYTVDSKCVNGTIFPGYEVRSWQHIHEANQCIDKVRRRCTKGCCDAGDIW